MNICHDNLEIISAYVDGELPENEKQLLEEHLAACEACSAVLEFYREISIAAEESAVTPPSSLVSSVMDKIRSDDTVSGTTSVKRPISLRLVLTRYAPVAACLAVILLALPVINNLRNAQYDSAAPLSANIETGGIAPAMASPDSVYDGAAAGSGERQQSLAENGFAGNNDDQYDYDESESYKSEMPMPAGAPPPGMMTNDALDTASDDGRINSKTGDFDSESAQAATEVLMRIGSAYAWLTFTGELPPEFDIYEQTPVGDDMEWAMYFEIPVDLLPVLLDALGDLDDIEVMMNDSRSDYVIVMYSTNR